MPSITDWMTVVAALVAAAAAMYAAIYTKRAAEAGAKAATEAANQVRELRVLREPRAVLVFRIPDQLTGEHQIKYGRGNNQYRSGTPVYLDVWNVSGPTIMVMEVAVKVNNTQEDEKGLSSDALTPQLLVESGKVVSIVEVGNRSRQINRAIGRRIAAEIELAIRKQPTNGREEFHQIVGGRRRMHGPKMDSLFEQARGIDLNLDSA